MHCEKEIVKNPHPLILLPIFYKSKELFSAVIFSILSATAFVEANKVL